jgi:hypothetical protein
MLHVSVLMHHYQAFKNQPPCLDKTAFLQYSVKYNTKSYSHKQLYRHTLVTGFGYLSAIIKPEKCGSTITRNHTNALLPIIAKLITIVIKTWETISSIR